MKKLPKAITENLVIQNTKDETLIYNLSSNKAFCLNETSALVWKLCDGKHSSSKISSEIGGELGAEVSVDLVNFALRELYENNLIDQEFESSSRFNKVSRRKAVKQIGIGSMIALPLITSIVSPRSVSAQSCIGQTGFVPGTSSPDTNQPDSATCESHCDNQTPDDSTSCCSMLGNVTSSFTMATMTCQCPGYQCF